MTDLRLTPKGQKVVEKIRQENAECQRQADEYNKEHGTNLTWVDFKEPWYYGYLDDKSVCVNVRLEQVMGLRKGYEQLNEIPLGTSRKKTKMQTEDEVNYEVVDESEESEYDDSDIESYD